MFLVPNFYYIPVYFFFSFLRNAKIIRSYFDYVCFSVKYFCKDFFFAQKKKKYLVAFMKMFQKTCSNLWQNVKKKKKKIPLFYMEK